MKKTFFCMLFVFLFIDYINGIQRSFSLTMVRKLEKYDESKNKTIWINFPINENYKFVESKKIEKHFLENIDSEFKKEEYLKLSEWNIESIDKKESLIQCLLWDQEFYLIIIQINAEHNTLRLSVENVNEIKFDRSMNIPCYRKGNLVIDKKKYIEKTELITFELKDSRKYFVRVKSVNSIKNRKKYRIDGLRKYILWIDHNPELYEGRCFTKNSRIIVNVHTNYFGTTNKLVFLSGGKKCEEILKEKISKWGFDSPETSCPNSYRTVLFFISGKN